MLGVHINPVLDFREHFLHITKDFWKLAKALEKRKLSPPLKSMATEQLLKSKNLPIYPQGHSNPPSKHITQETTQRYYTSTQHITRLVAKIHHVRQPSHTQDKLLRQPNEIIRWQCHL